MEEIRFCVTDVYIPIECRLGRITASVKHQNTPPPNKYNQRLQRSHRQDVRLISTRESIVCDMSHIPAKKYWQDI
jgi:hypothetical protein